jgi:glycerophosphoryl diester phosphodiesterase
VPSNQTHVIVVGHRGASGHAPENTIAAIEAAIDQGAAFVEVDVQLTKDGEVVLLHDATLTRTTNARDVFPDREPWRVNDFTLAELHQLDAGGWFDPAYAGEKIPTLRSALAKMRDRIGLWLELKSPRLHPGLEKSTAEVLRSAPGDWLTAPYRCVATCFDNSALERFAQEVQYAVPFGQLGSTVPDDAELRRLSEWVHYYIPDCRALAPGDLVRIRAAGLRSAFWTPNDPVTVASLVAQGAVALISNYPALVSEVVDGTYAHPAELAVESLTGQTAVLRNVSAEPVELAGWLLRGDPAGRLWSGEAPNLLAAGARIELDLGQPTDSVALHDPDGTLVHVVARVP